MKTQEELNALNPECELLTTTLNELSEKELNEVVGGKFYTNEYHKSPDDVTFIIGVGHEVEVATGWFSTTVRCVVTAVRTEGYFIGRKNFLGLPPMEKSYRDEYYCKPLEDSFWVSEGWYSRADIEMPNLL